MCSHTCGFWFRAASDLLRTVMLNCSCGCAEEVPSRFLQAPPGRPSVQQVERGPPPATLRHLFQLHILSSTRPRYAQDKTEFVGGCARTIFCVSASLFVCGAPAINMQRRGGVNRPLHAQ